MHHKFLRLTFFKSNFIYSTFPILLPAVQYDLFSNGGFQNILISFVIKLRAFCGFPHNSIPVMVVVNRLVPAVSGFHCCTLQWTSLIHLCCRFPFNRDVFINGCAVRNRDASASNFRSVGDKLVKMELERLSTYGNVRNFPGIFLQCLNKTMK
jgi:hypothetical protein